MKVKNDAEYLVQIINGKRYFDGKPLSNATMLWKCTIVGCTTPPKPQRRGKYEDRLRCNTCANREKSQNPEFLVKRGKAISKAIANLGDKWSEVSTKNMANQESRDKISNSMKVYIQENKEDALEIRRKTAIINNTFTGFGTSDFSKQRWDSLDEEQRKDMSAKISEGLRKEGKIEHERLVKDRFPEFEIVEYGYPDTIYKCPKDHLFPMRGNNFLKRGTCTVCTPKSQLELDMYDWFCTICPEAKRNKRVLFLDETNNGNRALEIDIFDVNKKLGIEVHGLYFHQETRVGEKHRIKADLSDKHGITLMQFFEDEIINQKSLVESMIKSKYGLFEHVHYARKCTIKEIDSNTAKDFLLSNHLQGDCKAFYKLGLFSDNKLVSLLTFRKYEEVTAEIARYCTLSNHQVIGGFAKLLKHAENYLRENKFNTLVTFSDRRYSTGNVYSKNGFTFVKRTVPDFFWVKNGTRYDRHISWGKTKEGMINDKYYIILGAGHVLWEKQLL